MTTLRQELQLQGGHFRVIRRRVAWLLGQWTGVRFSPDLRPVLYSAMLSLLQPNEDLVVRLTASHALKLAMDDFDFSTDQFLEYLEPIIGLLFNLLKECKECESKVSFVSQVALLLACQSKVSVWNSCKLFDYRCMFCM